MASNTRCYKCTYTTTATTYDSGGTPPASFDADNGDYFRCRVNATGATEVTSNSAQLTVTRTITVTQHPQNDYRSSWWYSRLHSYCYSI